MKNKAYRGMGIYFILIIIGLALYFVITSNNADIYTAYDDKSLEEELKDGTVSEVDIVQNREVPTGTVYVKYDDGSQVIYYTPDVKDTLEMCRKKAGDDVKVMLEDIKRPSLFVKLAPYIFAVILAIVILAILLSQTAAASGGNSKLMNFGKSRAKKDVHTGIGFKDVAGLREEKEDLQEVVDFLRNPAKYMKMGARIPKGILLVGSPGTGKTLLAKAVAGEADVPFFSISGSDFVEMFVGVGASRVRDLFEDAKKNAPCMVFIDEIDAVARRRGTGLGGGHDEREQTLNQLLVEMDGFGTNEGIIVLAATNRVDILDPAIMRPGRFDRKVMVGRPDVGGREEILKVHIRNKHLAEDVNIHEIARTTVGFSGADLENLMNEAAIRAAKDNRAFITKEDVDKSFVKVGIGTEKKSRIIPEKEKKITAYHEAGHAILFHELSEVGPVHLISIIPTGPGAAGYTMPLPENDNIFNTRKKMLQTIMVDFGGRIAEELIFNDITTGASQDIKQATATARDMVIKYGFSEKVGPINYETNDDDEVFLGRDLGHARNFGEEVAGTIDSEVKRIIDECYTAAKTIIVKNMDVLHKSAELLLENEKITGAEFDALFTES
ncbi:MAG: ATP-dependent zinc metalloprotease FtsH [Eubacterium sp.]|nr:ATP-dependent zinc metalloprotease FtsH [Eubacterium sp.]